MTGRALASRLLTRIRDRRRLASREADHFALDAVAGNMIEDYGAAVAHGEPRDVLAGILTGLAGCELAMSRTTRAMGWDPDPTPGEPEHAESVRLSGLLVQEIACCAAEGNAYRGVRCRELETEPVAAGLRFLAQAYADAPTARVVGKALSSLCHDVVGVIGSQAAEVLVPLMIAHRYNPYACTCEACGEGPVWDAAEMHRRAEVTEGCDLR